ncbi:MAG: transferase [Rhizobiales bacterium]|nr:transferase [Hyphomicrobiales bacterium]
MSLRIEPNQQAFEDYLKVQLQIVGVEFGNVQSSLPDVYARLEGQFARIRNKYFSADGGPVLRVANNAQYTIVLYHLSRAAFVAGDREKADRIYSLLRIVSGVDLYYEVELPNLWFCDHPLGTVVGRAKFDRGASLVFSQNCNIGNNKQTYPEIKGNLYMYPNSSLLGEVRVEGNVVLGNGACVIDEGVLKDCMVFGRSPDLAIKPLSATQFAEITAFDL